MRPVAFSKIAVLGTMLLLQIGLWCVQCNGAAGEVDLSFDPGSGINGPVHAVALQPDGKMIVYGQFTTVRGLARFGIARLHPDGTGDRSFDAGLAILPHFQEEVVPTGTRSIAIQPNGKILVGGTFGIKRLHPDGSADSEFNPQVSLSVGWRGGRVRAIAVQPDGKVLVGGDIISVDGTNLNWGITRLNYDGSLDPSFRTGRTGNSTGVWHNEIDGFGAAGPVHQAVLQPDGKILLGGFIYVREESFGAYGLVRLNQDGTLDDTFSPSGYPGYSVALAPDGRIVVGSYTGWSETGEVVRFNADGSLDETFVITPDMGIGYVHAVAVRTDGKVVFSDGCSLRQLNSDGSRDQNFNSDNLDARRVLSIVVEPAGTLLIAGEFTQIGGVERYRMSRLSAGGDVASTFNPSGGLVAPVTGLALQPDGKAVVSTLDAFSFVNQFLSYGEFRLNNDGSADKEFVAGSLAHDPEFDNYSSTLITGVAVQPDGKIIVAGYSTSHDEFGTFLGYTHFVRRRNPDGSRDPSFTSVTSWNDYIWSVAVQSDGKVIVGGSFTQVGGTERRMAACLKSDGSLDSAFIPALENVGVVGWVAESSGRPLIAGSFTLANGAHKGIARLNSDGTLDTGFESELTGGPLAVQPDGRIVVSSPFVADGVQRWRLTRLMNDGGFDSSFKSGLETDGRVNRIGLQPDGKILLAGSFGEVGGVTRPYLARLHGDFSGPDNILPISAITSPPNGAVFLAPANVAVVVDASDSDGIIARVDVRAGTTLIASDESPPFETTWMAVAAGIHTITATAVDNAGASITSTPVTITVTAPGPPNAPSGLTATSLSRSRIELKWSDNSNNELGFKIERSVRGKPFKQIATTPPNVISYSDTGLSAGTKYNYRLRAHNAAGDSDYSNQTSVKTKRRFQW